MKKMKNILLLLLLLAASGLQAQTKSDKNAAKLAAVKAAVEAKHYTFVANYVLPQRGSGHYLTSSYDVRVTKDSVITYLPYFGRAYFDVGYSPNDAGINFTSTKFDYKVTEKKKGGWEISIKPSDVRNIAQLQLYISPDGYTTLSVNSINRDFITFDGYLTDKKK